MHSLATRCRALCNFHERQRPPPLFPYSAQPYSAAPASGIFAVLDVMMLLLIVLTVLAPAARAGLCRYI
jgi:hypothetical protein